MRFLLDTHVLLWMVEDSPRLTAAARGALTDPGNEFWASAASFWEIAIKTRLGKLQLTRPLHDLEQALAAAGCQALDVTIRHAIAITHVAGADPFDHLLLAQCESETLRLMTADRVLKSLPVAFAV